MRPRVIYEGGKREKFKSALICANHARLDDPVLMQCTFWYRRLYSLATSELYSTRLSSFFFSHINCIPVDKKNFSMDSFHAVCDRLNAGKAVLIFPEGGLNNGDENELKALKSGVALMALQTRSPIIPTYIIPPKSIFSRRRVIVGKSFDPSALFGARPGMAAIEQTTALLRERELELKALADRL